ncbi:MULTISPECIES: LLM class flavin-dependent oxidoreductase [Streptomyces]|uniref:LLM class flavin-dependent oxidoreductase n=1 Tax=Streptomyces hawaiiensis TaxID=67305 RepID=A0A6G5RLY5_9ACTN|nr:LLM class flavin-dependent oxidoreductase [Streptomyces hawaiiensis]QCD59155.1 LLM class flavin-dependent oxidoreductase [Streptomyces hawaiiensis]
MSLRLSTVILPHRRWHEGGKILWERAEELGFNAGYTYDHLSWRSFRNRSWFGALPTLTAASTVTQRMRLGTLVTTPNFRHPVSLAKELISLDDVSQGRFTLGVGSGGTGFDATALGQEPWSPRERADRYAEFVLLLDLLLRQDTATGTSYDGSFYSASEVRNIPGCVQRPRLPFAVAAAGPRGIELAARYGQAWVTTGDMKLYENGTPEQSIQALRKQIETLSASCKNLGRNPDGIERILLTGFTPDRSIPLQSLDAFVDFAGRHAQLGFTEIVIHWPIPDSYFAADERVFERIATESLAQLDCDLRSVVP